MIQRPRRYSNYTHPVMTLHLLNIPLRRRPRGASRKGPGGWAHVYVLWPIKITHFENRSRGPKRLHPPRDLFQHPCEWNGWNAVLYNLETLRRHLYLVHWKDEEAQCASSSCYCFGGGGGRRVCGTGFLSRLTKNREPFPSRPIGTTRMSVSFSSVFMCSSFEFRNALEHIVANTN